MSLGASLLLLTRANALAALRVGPGFCSCLGKLLCFAPPRASSRPLAHPLFLSAFLCLAHARFASASFDFAAARALALAAAASRSFCCLASSSAAFFRASAAALAFCAATSVGAVLRGLGVRCLLCCRSLAAAACLPSAAGGGGAVTTLPLSGCGDAGGPTLALSAANCVAWVALRLPAASRLIFRSCTWPSPGR